MNTQDKIRTWYEILGVQGPYVLLYTGGGRKSSPPRPRGFWAKFFARCLARVLTAFLARFFNSDETYSVAGSTGAKNAVLQVLGYEKTVLQVLGEQFWGTPRTVENADLPVLGFGN